MNSVFFEEMERSLYKNEADVLSAENFGRRAPNYTAIGIGTVVAVVGLIAMIWSVQADQTVVGIIGFVVTFGGVMAALSIPGKASTPAPSEKPAKAGRSRSLMDQLTERWERRQGGSSV
jgi:Protein of unknown function (DUF3040).